MATSSLLPSSSLPRQPTKPFLKAIVIAFVVAVILFFVVAGLMRHGRMTRRMARQLLVLPSEVQDEEREERGRGRDRIRSVRVTRIRREENNKKPRKERGEDVPMWREIRLEGPGIEAGWAKEGLNEQREAEQVRMPISAHLVATPQVHLTSPKRLVEVSFFILSPRPSRDIDSAAEEEEDGWLPDMDFGITRVGVQES